MRVERIKDAAAVLAAADLFDAPPIAAATERFLATPGHHLLFAYEEGGRAVGMISGVEMTHPDKGTEMFIYELGVAPVARLQGIGTRLVAELAGIARENGCYGMWVGTEVDNEAALATYRRAGATDETSFTLLNWDLLEGVGE
ncbi:ribosomal protein S18 acetylase RimI-like enzyme [Actinoplanes tereljensis]|uniref:N-acetyltransferase n=1 Tax=Paractinoplanes tereljensis TaxID=571912 RepID=A0A919NSY3_9ACTN|nr:GNAT family N-acetyltransferase [Actinoplanes tereljensis]GIF24128.1 N-acetyltransferase [Actinoplanes tereljensis]